MTGIANLPRLGQRATKSDRVPVLKTDKNPLKAYNKYVTENIQSTFNRKNGQTFGVLDLHFVDFHMKE